MKQAITTRSFTRSDTMEYVGIGRLIVGDDEYIGELAGLGSVRDVREYQGELPEGARNAAHDASPQMAVGVGVKLSASPAAPASIQTTAKPFASGARSKRDRAA